MKMKTSSSVFISLLMLMAGKTFASDKVDVKCHVVLVGGSETIHYANIPRNSLDFYEGSLIDNRILVTGKRGKKSVYKVNECVLASRKFKRQRSNTLDENQVK